MASGSRAAAGRCAAGGGRWPRIGTDHGRTQHGGRGRTSTCRGRQQAATQAPAWSAAVPIAATLAHIYTEGARIWNPIHTDRAVARAAGLPAIILHGTATLALAVSQVLRREPRGPAAGVRRILCRFGAMVEMPSAITVEGLGATDTAEGRWVAFRALTAEGHAAVRDGRLLVDD